MSTRDIHDQLKDIYGIELSAEMVSKITDRIIPVLRNGSPDHWIRFIHSVSLMLFIIK